MQSDLSQTEAEHNENLFWAETFTVTMMWRSDGPDFKYLC